MAVRNSERRAQRRTEAHRSTNGASNGRRPRTVAELRRTVLSALDRSGPTGPGGIPRAWPITRDHVRLVLSTLVEEGLAERVRLDGEPAAHAVAITEAGRRALERLDWDEAVRLDALDAL